MARKCKATKCKATKARKTRRVRSKVTGRFLKR